MRIANYVQKAGRPHTSDLGNMVDEPSPDAVLPEVWLDEQGVQLRTAVGPRQHGGKAGHGAAVFCDEDAARLNLLDRQCDRVRIREERVAIAAVRERGAPLQRLEARTLGRCCRTDHNVAHPAILSTLRQLVNVRRSNTAFIHHGFYRVRSSVHVSSPTLMTIQTDAQTHEGSTNSLDMVSASEYPPCTRKSTRMS